MAAIEETPAVVPAVEPVAETTVAPEGAEAPAATDATPTAAEVAKDETAAVPTDAVVAELKPPEGDNPAADEEEAKRKREDEVAPITETETEAEQVEPVAKVQAVGDDAPTKAAAAPESGNITGTPTPVLHSQPAAVVAEVA